MNHCGVLGISKMLSVQEALGQSIIKSEAMIVLMDYFHRFKQCRLIIFDFVSVRTNCVKANGQ